MRTGSIKESSVEAAPLLSKAVSLDDLVHEESVKNGINEDHFRAVIGCESQWNITAEGDNHTSFGLLQVHLPAHEDITKEEAEDPSFIIPWGAKEYAKNPEIWSCFFIEKKNGWR